jgi:hypothetical protein
MVTAAATANSLPYCSGRIVRVYQTQLNPAAVRPTTGSDRNDRGRIDSHRSID